MNIGLIAHDGKKKLSRIFVLLIEEFLISMNCLQPQQQEDLLRK